MQLPPLGLYVHLPWCERKCPYCDFNSHEASAIPEDAYVDALLLDLESQAALAQGRAVQTLFIGGGTPSLFSGAAIARLMQGIAGCVELAPDLEATMEANPGSAEAAKFAQFRAAGINRLSIGIQSFGEAQLRALGRIHDSEQAAGAIEAARSAGFDNFNIDLMHGLPGQDPADAARDLRRALAFEPPHLSWYQLTSEPNTVFHKRPPPLPVEDALASIQDRGEQLLHSAGLEQYEVSAYSRPGAQCRHNRNYWEFGDYLAIGAGAHGKLSHRDGRIERFQKSRKPADYMAAPTQQRVSALAGEELRAEFMLNALRLREGFSLQQFEQRTGLERTALYPELELLLHQELLEQLGGAVRATALGWRFLDSVIGRFL